MKNFDREWETDSLGRRDAAWKAILPSLFVFGEINMSTNFERWKELATLCLQERDPARLTELASEMNLALTQKTPTIHPSVVSPAVTGQSR